MNKLWHLLRVIFSVASVFAILALIVAVLKWDGFFNVQSILVSYINPGDVPKWLQPLLVEEVQDLQKWKGKDLASLDLQAVQADIRLQPWVKEVRLSRSWPKQLEVQIGYKELVAYARTKKGKLVPLLDDGSRLPAEEFQEKYNLPLLTIELSQGEPARIKTALQLLSVFPKDGSLHRDRISEIGYDPKEGFWTVILPWGTRIKWGENEFERKISRVRQVVDYLESRRIEARVIDANLSKKVVVRLRKTP